MALPVTAPVKYSNVPELDPAPNSASSSSELALFAFRASGEARGLRRRPREEAAQRGRYATRSRPGTSPGSVTPLHPSDKDEPTFAAFREVPRTGVIYVTAEANRRGFAAGVDDWYNLGQGQPETDLPLRIRQRLDEELGGALLRARPPGQGRHRQRERAGDE